MSIVSMTSGASEKTVLVKLKCNVGGAERFLYIRFGAQTSVKITGIPLVPKTRSGLARARVIEINL